MYQVTLTFKAEGYNAFKLSGIFIPKGKTCRKDKIEEQLTEFLTPKIVKNNKGIKLFVTKCVIKRLPHDFVLREE